jgi:type I site-specific restriction-modification system R (restriction) subunit
MPKAIKYYTDEEIDKKIQEIEAIKAERSKIREEKLNMAKIAYMDSLLKIAEEKPDVKEGIQKRINNLIQVLNPRKDKKIIEAYNELLKTL